MPGQDGRGWVAGVAALLACVLLAAVGVAALRTDTASADTVLTRGTAVLTLADGTSRDAGEGERVPRGATVRAGRAGAVLTTVDREVHLGADTAVTVLDGVRQALRSGFVIVDASDAPGLELAADAATVTADDGSLVRVEAGPLLRVGVLRGDAASVRAAGRRATTEVDTYYQVQVPNGGLPGPTTPLVLTGDAYERTLAADLVAADEDLNALASRLDSGESGRVVQTALRKDVPASVVEDGGSESTLGYLLASAAEGSAPLAERYEQVRDLRTAGGSWGVVAAIVSAEVSQVSAALSALLGPAQAPALASGSLDVNAMLGFGGTASVPGAAGTGGSAPDGPSGTGDTDGPRQDGDDGDEGGEPDAPPPSEQPRPTDPVTDPLPDPVEEPVEDVIDTVLDIVSSPSPAPLPLPLPLPLPSLPAPGPGPVTVPQVLPSPIAVPGVPLLK